MKREKIPLLSIVVPCFNEEELLANNIKELLNILSALSNKNKIDKNSFLYLVDDGSTDKTWDIISEAHKKNKNIKALKFIKNFGMQKALLAGYESSNILGCDCAISIDADLQQDINSIENFIDEYTKDSSLDIILGVRNDRKADSFSKKATANIFYILAKILGLKLVKNHADYRLVSKKALEMLSLYKNKHFFFRSFFLNIGLKYSCLYFDVKKANRKSRFSILKMLFLAFDSFTLLNLKPLRILLICGFLILSLGILLNLLLAYLIIFLKYSINRYNIIWAIFIFFSGLHIFSIGIIGEYVGKILENQDNAPKYIKETELK